MSYVKFPGYSIGDEVITTRIHESCGGYFEIGSKVKIIDIDSIRGYSIQDNFGNRILEIGWYI